MGVRADESVTRSKYDEINLGTKHQGQYDYYPILNWNSAELFLYIYSERLILNETYKKGNSRAGCLVCPMEATKSTWFKEQSYAGSVDDSKTTTFYNNIIIDKTFARDLPPERLKEFMEIGVWKSRHNGSKLSEPRDYYHEQLCGKDVVITLDKLSANWREWLKTVGEITYISECEIEVFCNDKKYILTYSLGDGKNIFVIRNLGTSQNDIYFGSWIKTILKKSAYCISCQVCEANCPHGFIHMESGKFYIDDKCVKCKKCYKINGGCVVAASQRLPKEGNRMNGSIDQYKTMGIRYAWVVDFLQKRDEFWADNNLGSAMLTSLKSFLRHAGLLKEGRITQFGEIISDMGVSSSSAWGLMLCNLVYTPQFNWWVMNIQLNRVYTQAEIDEMLKNLLTDNSKRNVINGFKVIFNTNPVLSQQIGFGRVNVEEKGRATFLTDAYRTSWEDPDAKVILYSLYKFAEACGEYYQFTLETLLDDSIERDGVSPTRIFGLNRETMVRILNGLTVNYPEFISASFTLDLDTITLRPTGSELTSEDVLKLFE